MKQELVYSCILSYLIPLILGGVLWFKERLFFSSKVLAGYLLFSFLFEITGIVLAVYGVHNLWLYRIYLYVEVFFPTIFFVTYFKSSLLKYIAVITFVIVVILTTILNCFENWEYHASFQTGITFTYISFLILSYFIEMFREEKVVNPFKDLPFVVGSIILLSQSSTFLYNLLYNQLSSGYFGDSFHMKMEDVNVFLTMIYNILYAYALWVSKKDII